MVAIEKGLPHFVAAGIALGAWEAVESHPLVRVNAAEFHSR